MGPLEEVDFVGGVAGASSEYRPHVAKRAFINKAGMAWRSLHATCPHIIWYDFGDLRVRPVNMSFEMYVKHAAYAPTHFQFVGTNDKCDPESRWTVLCTANDPKVSGKQFGECQLADSSEKYRCLGMKILKTKHNRAAVVHRVRVWHIVQSW